MPPLAQPPSWLDRVSKWARLHRRSVDAAISVGLLLLVITSITTVTFVALQRAADQSRQRAEDNFHEALRAVEHFGVQLPEELAQISGAERVHREFLTEALAYYQRFASQQTGDESLREEIALSHSKIGTLQDRAGARAEALQSHRKALELFTRLQQTEPQNVDHQRHLGLCQNNLGQLYSEMGDTTAARLAFDEALRWQQSLVKVSADATYRADLALTQNNLALLLYKAGEPEPAVKLMNEAIRSQRELANERQDRRDDLDRLTMFYLNMSGMLTDTDPELARGWSESSLKVCQQLTEIDPDSPVHLQRLASVSNQLGMLQSKAGQLAEALNSHRSAQQIFQQLHATAPLQKEYRADLALTWNSLGTTLELQRDHARAATCFEHAIKLQAGLV